MHYSFKLGELKEYTLSTVSYGTKSTPYLTLPCLKELDLKNVDDM